MIMKCCYLQEVIKLFSSTNMKCTLISVILCGFFCLFFVQSFVVNLFQAWLQFLLPISFEKFPLHDVWTFYDSLFYYCSPLFAPVCSVSWKYFSSGWFSDWHMWIKLFTTSVWVYIHPVLFLPRQITVMQTSFICLLLPKIYDPLNP